MKEFFGDQELVIRCAKCGHDLRETIARFKTSAKVGCPNCGVINDLDATESSQVIDQANKAINDVRDEIRKLSKVVSKAFKR